MSDRTPTTQKHWERYADELLAKWGRAEQRIKELEEALRELMVFCTSGEAYELAERVLRGEERPLDGSAPSGGQNPPLERE